MPKMLFVMLLLGLAGCDGHTHSHDHCMIQSTEEIAANQAKDNGCRYWREGPYVPACLTQRWLRVDCPDRRTAYHSKRSRHGQCMTCTKVRRKRA